MLSPSGLRRRVGRLVRRAADPPLHRAKLRAIDFAFEDLGVRSVADLGGVWAVHGGYTFHALESHHPDRAVLVDEDLPPAVRDRAAGFPALELVQGNFGSADMPGRVGAVDALLLFDVLLHQVAPDWDEILSMYAQTVWCMVVVQPQYVAGGTVRLFDLGEAGYEAAVPPGSFPTGLFGRLDEPHPTRPGRRWRDVHEVWQWGIADDDLRARMRELGFEPFYWSNGGGWRGSPAFEDHAFVFARPERATPGLLARGPQSGEAYDGA